MTLDCPPQPGDPSLIFPGDQSKVKGDYVCFLTTSSMYNKRDKHWIVNIISLIFLLNVSHVIGPGLPPDNGYPPLLSHRGYHGLGTSPWHSTWDYLSKIAYETIWEVLSISQSVLSFLEPDNPMVKCLDPHWVPPRGRSQFQRGRSVFPSLNLILLNC